MSRSASVGLAVVLVVVSGFMLALNYASSRAAQRAISAAVLSDAYQSATKAVISEESLERKYRLEPGPSIRQRHQAAAVQFSSALAVIMNDGATEDRLLISTLRTAQTEYLRAIHDLFAAVDRHDTAEALRIDHDSVDPRFDAIEEQVNTAAEQRLEQSTDALHQLKSLEHFATLAAPVALVLGGILIALFGSVLRRIRRELQSQREDALHDSMHDPLTGLANRALLADRFEQALLHGTRTGSRTGLLLLDLNRFKEVNDTLGHHFGDRLLMQIGPRMSTVLRAEDTVARLGGDEFAVLLPDIDSLAGAVLVAQKLLLSLESPFTIDDLNLDVEASVGVVLSGEHGTDAATLLQRADIAMYVAKNQDIGVFAYQPDIDGNSREKLTLLSDLRRALASDELVLHYQPKISVSTGHMCGVEALVRWNHPRLGMVAPDQFIPLAEHTGLIGPLTHYVLDHALAQIREWSDAGYHIPIAVNLSARNLLDDKLPDKIVELLAHHGVAAELLELEVTASAIMTEPLRAQALLTRLHAMGAHISIDDFGAGYTSLAQLKNLPVSELKIDRSFVTSMDTDVSNSHIVKTVIDLGHNLGLTAVAEGVETEATLVALREIGCDVAQGYYICRPVPAPTLTEWYQRHNRVLLATVGGLPALAAASD